MCIRNWFSSLVSSFLQWLDRRHNRNPSRTKNLRTALVNGMVASSVMTSIFSTDVCGDGIFPDSFTIQTTSQAYAYSAVTGDFNGDGILDLATANVFNFYGSEPGTVSVLLGTGDGNFDAPTTLPASVSSVRVFISVSDINGDGFLDLTNGTDVFLGSQDGIFTPLLGHIDTQFRRMVIEDFNNDGILDLAGSSQNDVVVLLGEGNVEFGESNLLIDDGIPESIVSGDFNNDDIPDLAISNRVGGGIFLFMGDGNGGFGPRQETTSDVSNYDLAAADFDGDGNLDLASVDTRDSVSVLLGNGNGTFSSPMMFAVNSGPKDIATADFNGDGIADLAVSEFDNSASVLLGNGDGTFETQNLLAKLGFFGGRTLAVADFDGDGWTDVAVTVVSASGFNMVVWPNASPNNPLLGDINQDGVVDLLDVGPFVDLLVSGGFQSEGDIDGDGKITLLDVEPFVDLLSGN